MSRTSRGSSTEKYHSVFATRLRLLFDEKPNATQAQLSELVGVTRQTVSQYVNGISEPGYDALVKIADYFDVSLDYLLGRTTTRTTNLNISCQAAEIPTHGLPINPLHIKFIILNEQEGYFRIIPAETAIDALRQHVEYCNCGTEENKAFQILCDSGQMSLPELISCANRYLLPNYCAVQEIYILGEKVAGI